MQAVPRLRWSNIFAPGNKSVRKEIGRGGIDIRGNLCTHTLARAVATFPRAPDFSDGQIIDFFKEMRRLALRAFIALDLEPIL